MTEWFERWFGEEYLHVYLHRDEEEAERLVGLLAARGWVGAGERVLDLGCGGGRHADALRRAVTRVLRRGGKFVLDFLNAAAVRATLVPRDERAFGDAVVVQERSISPDGRFVEKSIHLSDDSRTFTERVRLYDRGELERMLQEAGLRPVEALGDYDGGPYGAGSPRLIVMAEKP